MPNRHGMNGNGNGVPQSVRELSKEEMVALIDERARRLLGMTGDEFFEAAAEGTLPEIPAAEHLRLISGAHPR